MENKHRELIFKGMQRFRYRGIEATLEDARNGPYFWWWSYLRLSKDYWWVCKNEGLADDVRLREMYADFGDVYSMTFERWWKRRGIDLFSEGRGLPEVRQLDVQDIQLSPDTANHLLVEIPINMTEKEILAQVRRILRRHPNRAVKRISYAKRPLAKFKGIRKNIIESAHAVWRLHFKSRDGRAITAIGQARGSMSYYQIGKELRLVPSSMPARTDSKERAAMKVNAMKVAVSRTMSRANNLIANAALGTFPSMTPPQVPVVWKPMQKKRLEAAVERQEWRPLFEPNDRLIVQ